MNTIGYVMVLLALLLIRGLTKGRGIEQLPDDARDAFIAVIRNDQTALREVASRTGDSLSNTPSAPGTDVESGTPATGTAKGSVVGLTKSTRAGRDAIAKAYPGLTIGGIRLGADAQDHATGHAIDVMVYKDSAKGEAIAKFSMTLPEVKYVIWNQCIWNVSRAKEGWRSMASRGSTTANHKDHVHVSFK